MIDGVVGHPSRIWRVSCLLVLLWATGTTGSQICVAATVPLKPHAQIVEEVVAFLLSDVGFDGILTMDGDPEGEAVPPYFYHYAIRHTNRLRSSTSGYPGYASISYPGYTMSIAIDAFLAWWAYSGDPQGLARARQCADWLLPRRTPPGDLYANWVYSTQTDGVMGGGYDEDAVMSDKPGMFGTRLLRLFEITGEITYLEAARQIADTYVATQRSGSIEEDGRWPFRVRPSDGLIRQDYTSHLIPTIELLERMEQREEGRGYGQAAARAWNWLLNNPLEPTSPSYMRWEGFYEDIGPESAGLRDHYSAEATAVALLQRGAAGDLERAIEIRDWSTQRYLAPDGVQNGSGQYHPALLEWDAWMNSTYAATAQWAVLQLRLFREAQGTPLQDPSWQTLGLQALHTLTYGQVPDAQAPGNDGRMLTTIRELTQPSFGTETWYEQNFNTVLYLLRAFELAPELAPADENHLIGFAGGELMAIDYGPPRISSSWSAPGEASFKLSVRPRAVLIGGIWHVDEGVDEEGLGWSWDALTQLCSVEHGGGEVAIEPEVAAGVAVRPGAASVTMLSPAPNPFNPRVVLRWQLIEPANVRLWISDLRGREIVELRAGPAPAGQGRQLWDGTDARGRPVASGVYTAWIEAGQHRDAVRLSLIR